MSTTYHITSTEGTVRSITVADKEPPTCAEMYESIRKESGDIAPNLFINPQYIVRIERTTTTPQAGS
jgi:hypothetical protein